MKRGLLEACVLASVCADESYGYQIIGQVPAVLGLTESTLYPLLRRLQTAGDVSVRSAEHNGRLRKYYRITDQGRERLVRFTSERAQMRQVYDYVERQTKGSGHDDQD